jgi:hypothetical protein
MRFRDSLGWALMLLAAAPLWAQSQPAAPVPAVSGVQNGDVPNPDFTNSDNDPNSTRMLTPPPTSGGTYPVAVGAEERANYLRGGVTFDTAYSDNVLAGASATPLSSVSYSVWPTIALDETSSRLHWVLAYAPGFTFYQKLSAYNESDENLALELTYRLSPHLTFSARDGLQKSSNVFNQPFLGAAGAVSGGTTVANQSVIAPLADRLSNNGSVGLTYQFAANSMIGASGSFANLHYPNPAQVSGLFDSESEEGSGFYAVRIAKRHYVGSIYQYQRLLSYPAPGTNETETHAALAFYTWYPSSKFSASIFGGPQYADSSPQFAATGSASSPASQSWKPDAGGSLSWQGLHNSAAVSYLHMVASGGGLLGAVQMDSATLSLRQQVLRTLNATVLGSYAQNDLLVNTPLASGNGHTVSGTALLQQFVGQRFNVQLGYTRLHQDYSTVAALATNPDTNREFISISYQFSHALGR